MTAHAIEEPKADTRTRILDEAERLFRHYGYAKTTVSDIARELGMSPANVYRFFASKAAINEAIAERIVSARVVAADRIARSGDSAEARLQAILVGEHRASCECLFADRKVHEMVVVAMQEQWETIRRYLDRLADIIEAVIRDGVAAGEFPNIRDAREAALCVRQSFCALTHPLLLANCMDSEHASAESLANFVIRSLKA